MRLTDAILFAVAAAALAPLASVALPSVFGLGQPHVVLSGSMAPLLQPGDLVLLRPAAPTGIAQGDVIAYRGAAGGAWVLHRVSIVEWTDHGLQFLTSGDANAEADPAPVAAADVAGVYVYHVPAYGHFVLLAKSKAGILVFVIAPSILIVARGLLRLVRPQPG